MIRSPNALKNFSVYMIHKDFIFFWKRMYSLIVLKAIGHDGLRNSSPLQ